MFTFKSVRSISFFSRNKYIDIELPSLICTEFPFFTLGTTLILLASHTHTQRARACARTRARTLSSLLYSLALFFLSLSLFLSSDSAINRVFCTVFLSSYLLARLSTHHRRSFSLFAFSLPPPRTRALHLLVRTPGRTHAIIIIHYLHHHQHRRRHYHCHRS